MEGNNMDEIGQLRIYVAEKYFPVYHEVSGGNLFNQNSEFFILCVFVGEMNGRKEPIDKKQELCRAITLSDYDKTAVKALYLKHHHYLATFKEMIEYAEEYANGGFEWLLEEKLSDLLIQDGNGKWTLKDECEDELQLALMRYVLGEKQEVPF